MTAATENPVRRRKANKRQKKNWRKYIDTADVDTYLEAKRFEERIGGPLKSRKNEELFVVDDKPQPARKRLTKKQKALLPLRCLQNLEPLTKVPPSITPDRRRVRVNPIQRKKDEKRRLAGFVPTRVLQAKKDRTKTKILKKKKLKDEAIIFKNDAWDTENKPFDEKKCDVQWLTDDAIRHNLTNTSRLVVPPPKGITKKKSALNAIDLPHPGTSYNPSYEDHQDLVKVVVEKEKEAIKRDEHLKRVTKDMFSKVTRTEQEAMWLVEMTPPDVKEDEEKEDGANSDKPYVTLNPPTDRMKMKTRKQRNTQKRLEAAAKARRAAKIEKKKVADIYKLRFIAEDLKNLEKVQETNLIKRKQQQELNKSRTKRLGPKSFIEPDPVYAHRGDLRGNLRNIQKKGNLLADRFFSFQKRNILAPTSVQMRKKAKVKRFVKRSHRIEELMK